MIDKIQALLSLHKEKRDKRAAEVKRHKWIKEYGWILVEIRGEITQQEVAWAADVPQMYISSLERGKPIGSSKVLDRVFEVYTLLLKENEREQRVGLRLPGSTVYAPANSSPRP